VKWDAKQSLLPCERTTPLCVFPIVEPTLSSQPASKHAMPCIKATAYIKHCGGSCSTAELKVLWWQLGTSRCCCWPGTERRR
jgi:hypothetical protein